MKHKIIIVRRLPKKPKQIDYSQFEIIPYEETHEDKAPIFLEAIGGVANVVGCLVMASLELSTAAIKFCAATLAEKAERRRRTARIRHYSRMADVEQPRFNHSTKHTSKKIEVQVKVKIK